MLLLAGIACVKRNENSLENFCIHLSIFDGERHCMRFGNYLFLVWQMHKMNQNEKVRKICTQYTLHTHIQLDSLTNQTTKLYDFRFSLV